MMNTDKDYEVTEVSYCINDMVPLRELKAGEVATSVPASSRLPTPE